MQCLPLRYGRPGRSGFTLRFDDVLKSDRVICSHHTGPGAGGNTRALGLLPDPGYEGAEIPPIPHRTVRICAPTRAPPASWRRQVAKVIASSVRKGNVLDLNGKLAVVMHAENIHPGKGTPVTHLELRRIADGVKVVERYRTTDQVERAYLDEKDFNYLYEDDMGFNFMQPETFEQIPIPKDILGDSAVWLRRA